jgi:uncharacterized surface protein with fasciclin (FAS1) repeats
LTDKSKLAEYKRLYLLSGNNFMTIINRKKKQRLAYFILGVLAVSFYTSCVDRFDEIEKYQRPDRLQGKIYTLISSQDNMTIFSQFMVDAGYDKVVDKTGTYAAFVPTDEVMRKYLMEKYGASDPGAIDPKVKSDIVKYHILQMPWSKDQLQSLSSRGWINPTDISNNKPLANKRRTLLREPNRTYKIQRYLSGDNPFDIILPDNSSSSTTRTVFTSSQKYVPLFYDGFMNAKGLSSADYSFYFKRPYENGEVFYANAKMIGEDLFAENGFVYTIDQVVEPLKNAEQLLEVGPYAKFLQLIHNYPVFQFNQQATFAQEGAGEGAEVEDLYNLSYSGSFPMNIHDELVGNITSTVERHNGLLAPTDAALDQIFNEYLKGWGAGWSAVPKNIQSLIVNTHMARDAVYLKDLNTGFYNAVGDVIRSADFEVEDAKYGSNSTFIGLKKAIVPKFFSSVSAPLLLDPAYSSIFGAYVSANLLSAMKDPATKFSLFLIDNMSLSRDSSLFVSELPNGSFQILAFDHQEEKLVNMLSPNYKGILTRRLFGHIGVQPILGQAKREFIETLDGRHIVVQNDTVSGGVPSKFGFNSSNDTTVVFSEITNFPITNGRVYKCNGWFEFPFRNTYDYLRNTKFLALLNKVGLANTSNERLTFLDPTERYTIFVPSDAALNSIQVDTLSLDALKKLVNFHIVKGQLIFTDGRQDKKAYRTLNNQFLNLDPQPDNLLILDKNNDVLYDKLVLSPRSNLIGMYQQNINERYYLSNAVVHNIDKVIMPY